MKKIQAYVQMIENTLAHQDYDAEPRELYEPIHYILSLGGKRLRPALTLAACELLGGKTEDALMPAIGIEIFHNFSLVHDDIMDNASVRRGQKTVHEKWNTNIAILSGDAMLVKAYQYLGATEQEVLPKLLRSFSKMAIEVCEGQQYDMNFESKDTVNEDDYLEMIRLKTSVLLGAALEAGAIIARASDIACKALYNFGVNIGLAFQMQDDLLDSFGNADKFGKRIGGDILNGKKTLLYIYARNNSRNLPADTNSDEQKIKSFQNWFIETGAKQYVEEKRESFYHKAMKELEAIQGKPEVKSELVYFARSLVERDQ